MMFNSWADNWLAKDVSFKRLADCEKAEGGQCSGTYIGVMVVVFRQLSENIEKVGNGCKFWKRKMQENVLNNMYMMY